MAKIAIVPYKIGSASVRALQGALVDGGVRSVRVRSDSETFIPRPEDLIINWGSSIIPPQLEGVPYLNKADAVAIASNKLLSFQRFQETGVHTVAWTTHEDIAFGWLADGNIVIARRTLRGHSGEGIAIIRNEEDLIDAPLYTKYKKKRKEFRVHVFDGVVFDVQEKRREREVERTADESLIRSHQNGWVFCREDLDVEAALLNLAIRAVSALRLDFGAVDIIYNQRENQYYVLEVNTAVGLEGETLNKYKERFENKFRSI